MIEVPEVLKLGVPACTIYDSDTPEQVVAKIAASVYAVDGRKNIKELLPDYYRICKKRVEKKAPAIKRHKFF